MQNTFVTTQQEKVWEFPVQPWRFRLHIENAVTRNKPCTRNQVASEWMKKISIKSWVEFNTYIVQIITYILSFNYSYRYEINLIRIMYAANSSININASWMFLVSVIPNPRGGGGGYSHTLPIRICAAQRGRDFEAPDLERGIHFRGVF